MATLAADRGSVPSSHMAAHIHLYLRFGRYDALFLTSIGTGSRHAGAGMCHTGNRIEMRTKTRCRLTSSTWIRLGESNNKWFIAKVFKSRIIWGKRKEKKVSWWNTIPGAQEVQLHGNAAQGTGLSSRKMGPRGSLPELV